MLEITLTVATRSQSGIALARNLARLSAYKRRSRRIDNEIGLRHGSY
jgi:hypothetical protein